MNHTVKTLFVVVAIVFACSAQAEATLINSDFLVSGDNLLVTDTSTNLQYLSPFHTRLHSFNDSFVQSLITGDGFHYAVASTVLNMINNNFNNPSLGPPGDAASFVSAQNFFNIFGLNDTPLCFAPGFVPCPITQGFTATPGSTAGTHVVYGMIQLQNNGWLIADLESDLSTSTRMGSWLVRDSASAVPEPSTLLLLGAGLIGLAAWRQRRAGVTSNASRHHRRRFQHGSCDEYRGASVSNEWMKK